MQIMDTMFEAAELIKSRTEGYSQKELVKHFKKDKATISRWVPVFVRYFGIRVDPNDKRLKIGLKSNKIPFDFTIHEVQGICLAMRMLARKFWFPYNNAVTVMAKLARGTWRFSDILSTQIEQTGKSVKVRTTGDQKKDVEIQTSLQRLTRAIAEHKQVVFNYKKTDADSDRVYTMEPYALEPYPEGNGLYLIG
jgi:predicted DNA-binding transcriptional regulator YafY